MGQRRVRFALGDEGQAPYAMQLRITPKMLTAVQSPSAPLAGAGTLEQQQRSIQLDGASNEAVSNMTISLKSSAPNSIKWNKVTII